MIYSSVTFHLICFFDSLLCITESVSFESLKLFDKNFLKTSWKLSAEVYRVVKRH